MPSALQERPGGGYDVVVLGSALVDLLVRSDAAAVEAAGLEPGTMTLVDGEEADRLWAEVGGGTVVAGGSAANTAVGVAALGCRAALVGRVGSDQLGRAYVRDLEKAGVAFLAPPAEKSAGTGRCFVIVTPDGQRTMRTYLGAAPDLGPDCLEDRVLAGAGCVYLEGYLWDAPAARGTLERAVVLGRRAGAAVALSLSDPGCVERHARAFSSMIRQGEVDLLFANEAEVTRLMGVDDFDRAVEALRSQVPCAALTRGPHGAVAVAGGLTAEVPAEPAQVVDTTGAGDLFAAGFLVGRQRGLDLEGCARLGALAAADVISGLGARLHGDIGLAARRAGLLP